MKSRTREQDEHGPRHVTPAGRSVFTTCLMQEKAGDGTHPGPDGSHWFIHVDRSTGEVDIVDGRCLGDMTARPPAWLPFFGIESADGLG
jgi:hypothetical protein